MIGCAIGSRWGAQLAQSRLCVEDFYVPAHQRLFAIAHQVDGPLWDDDARAGSAAELAEVPKREVLELLRIRCVMADSGGAFAKRVAKAARRRRAMGAFADAYNAIGDGASVEEAFWIVDVALGRAEHLRAVS